MRSCGGGAANVKSALSSLMLLPLSVDAEIGLAGLKERNTEEEETDTQDVRITDAKVDVEAQVASCFAITTATPRLLLNPNRE